MLKNYFKIAYRNLARQKGYTFINVAGLAVGMACCILIALYIRDEFSYDRFHERADRIYRVLYVFSDGEPFAPTPVPLASVLEETIPEVERTVRLHRTDLVVRRGDRSFREEVTFADPAFFEVFSFPLVHGDPEAALRGPGNLVLTRDMAEKYFPGEDPMGRRLSVRLGETFRDFTVTGVAERLPSNSSVTFDVLLPMAVLADFEDSYASPNWGTLRPKLYLLLSPGADRAELGAKLSSFIERHDPRGQSTAQLRLQPITEVHLTPGIKGGLEPTSSPLYSYILAGIALLVLLIACINFMTLSVARSTSRAREVGVRKVMGAARRQLMEQFWGEALLLTTVALLIALSLVRLAFPFFSTLIGKELTFSGWSPLVMLLVLTGLVVSVSLVAGSYPAVFLSRFRPAEVLKGRSGLGGRRHLTRSLVVVQFALSIFLIASTLLMSRQMNLLQAKDLGFNEEEVLRIDVPFNEGAQLLERYQQALAAQPRVRAVAGTFKPLGYHEGFDSQARSTLSGDAEIQAHELAVSPDFLETLSLELLAGRSFSEAEAQDGVIVNAAMVKAFGWDEPLGQRVSQRFTVENAPVIGVVEDFHFQSLHHPIEPLFLRVAPYFTTIYVRIAAAEVPGTLALLESAWAEVAPDLPFEFTFLDEAIEQQYRAEERWARIIRLASLLAIFIACLGLFGLAALAAARRTKEIGIRKVLGASVASIMALLSKDFLGLVLAAFIVAVPIAYFAMSRWLESFAYRVEIGAGTFLLAGLVALTTALLTVSYQSARAALRNPVDTLRYE